MTLPPAAKFFGSSWETSLCGPVSSQLGSRLRDTENIPAQNTRAEPMSVWLCIQPPQPWAECAQMLKTHKLAVLWPSPRVPGWLESPRCNYGHSHTPRGRYQVC